jgi:pimeloyl-ACP methyl ester carboxylesterase
VLQPRCRPPRSAKVTQAAWETRPNWYIVSGDDRVVSVDLQREFADRMKAISSELRAGHLSLLSQPQAVADVIIQAVEQVAQAKSWRDGGG